MVYGYTRVSSRGQLENNSLEQQAQEILSKYEGAKIVKEQFTGTTTHRPILEALLASIKPNDILVVTKLDRLARTTTEGIELIQRFFEQKVSVHVLNVGLLENTSMGRFFLTTLLAVAELERNMIIERTQNGKNIAKQNPDFREGRPKLYSSKQIAHALDLLKSHTYKKVEQMMGISKSTLIRAKRMEKIKTTV